MIQHRFRFSACFWNFNWISKRAFVLIKTMKYHFHFRHWLFAFFLNAESLTAKNFETRACFDENFETSFSFSSLTIRFFFLNAESLTVKNFEIRVCFDENCETSFSFSSLTIRVIFLNAERLIAKNFEN